MLNSWQTYDNLRLPWKKTKGKLFFATKNEIYSETNFQLCLQQFCFLSVRWGHKTWPFLLFATVFERLPLTHSEEGTSFVYCIVIGNLSARSRHLQALRPAFAAYRKKTGFLANSRKIHNLDECRLQMNSESRCSSCNFNGWRNYRPNCMR